ncbi:hypothetical protein Tco_1365565 [Tanacetum coccineum]
MLLGSIGRVCFVMKSRFLDSRGGGDKGKKGNSLVDVRLESRTRNVNMESNFPSLSELAAKRNDGIMLRANGKPLKPIRGPQVVHAIPRNFRFLGVFGKSLGLRVYILVIKNILGVWKALDWLFVLLMAFEPHKGLRG